MYRLISLRPKREYVLLPTLPSLGLLLGAVFGLCLQLSGFHICCSSAGLYLSRVAGVSSAWWWCCILGLPLISTACTAK